MAITKEEFIQLAVNEIAAYPTLAKRYQIGDPLITQAVAAQAAMLADISNQIELTSGEVYLKARDSTVLADAAVKGVLPFATPTIAAVTLANAGTSEVQVLTGRTLIDQSGRYWRVLTGATVAAGATGSLLARQVVLREVAHTVSQNIPFYTVELTEPDIGYIAEVAVEGYTYTAEFCNVSAGDLVYHIKCDENQAMSVMFGLNALAGTQPAAGTQLAISIYDTEGAIALSVGAKFTFEYTNAGDQFVTMTLGEVAQAGAAPMGLVTMREVCGYPGIFNENAVFLSNFDFLVRKKVQSLTFLSVWNETREELIRGASVQNMNRLFIAAVRDGTNSATLQAEIAAVIRAADDSYRLRFVDAVEIEVPLVLTLTIPSTYDAASVLQTVRALVLANYGRTSAWARRGDAKILKKDLYELFKENVPALTQRLADISVDISGSVGNVLPEQFRYITEASLQVLAVSEQ